MLRVVLDTNVLVSGVLSPQGPPGWLLDLVLAHELHVVFDGRVLAEYRDVLTRSVLKLDSNRVDRLLEAIQGAGMAVTPLPWPVALPDCDDEPFLACAKAAQVPLVTGNLRHYPAACRLGVLVVSPREFLDLLSK